MASENEEDAITKALEVCSDTQAMIDITANQLDALRTQCSATDELSQQAIREAEAKLVKMFSKQLVTKAKLKTDPPLADLEQYPDTEQWLKIVAISDQPVKGVLEHKVTVEGLMKMSDPELVKMLERYNCSNEDVSRLTKALKNLRLWTESQLLGDKVPSLELHWSSYKSASSSPYGGNSPKFGHQQRPSTSSLPPDTYLNPQSPQLPTPPQSTPASPLPCPSPIERRRFTPPPTPSLVKPQKGKFPTTPPPQKKNKLYPETFKLHKSRSHDSQLSNRVNLDNDQTSRVKTKISLVNNLAISNSHETICQRKRSTDGSEQQHYSGQTSPLVSPKRFGGETHLMPPPSPLNTPLSRSMMHSIQHRFTNTFKLTSCELCHRPMFLGYKCKGCKFQTKVVMAACDFCEKHVFRGKVCRDCKMRFHKDCAMKAAPACGLPKEFVDFYIRSLNNGSPVMGRIGPGQYHAGDGSMNSSFVGARDPSLLQSFPDSSSNTSSCTSSTPSSPAAFMDVSSSHVIQVTSSSTQFHFPDVSLDKSGSDSGIIDYSSFSHVETQSTDNQDVVNTNTSNDSDKSDKTLVDTGSSSDKPSLLDRVDSQESTEDGLGQSWHRVNSISVTLKEWDIPYEDLVIGDVIGTGRFGKVYKGSWHGDVAIKMLNMDPDTDNQAQLQNFKMEVSMLRKTRHENLVLFMGACMKPPHLAIVTSLCKHHTLYTHIHLRKEKFQVNRAVIIGSQVSQGMGYLHAKGIIHKDLKTKNIFLENGKVVITDFGLFNITKLCHGTRKGDWLSIPQGWLCYLSPEIMRNLRAGRQYDMDMHFSKASDVYAFGTVWHELLVGDWPFKKNPPEVIIWQVGRGLKPSLGTLTGSKDLKEVLMACWAYKVEKRPDFSSILKTLEKIPKKRGLERCPSHPVHLSRSAESIF